MAGMVVPMRMERRMTGKTPKRKTGTKKEAAATNRYGELLRSLVACRPQLASIRHLRVQLHETENLARLAVVRCVLGVSRRDLYRNVRISAHDLSLLRLAHEMGSGTRFVHAQFRPHS